MQKLEIINPTISTNCIFSYFGEMKNKLTKQILQEIALIDLTFFSVFLHFSDNSIAKLKMNENFH